MNYYRTDIEDAFTTSYNYLGNFGSPGESRIFQDRISSPDFLFMKAYERFNKSPENMVFYNTQIPYTQLSYLSAGSKPNAEDHFITTFAGNVNKKIGVGGNLDYIYTRGFYNFQGVNSLSWQLYGYYMGDRYQVQAYTNFANFGNQENGGITDVDYILKPENVNENLTDPKNIPTNLDRAWNKIRHRDSYLTQRYNLGFEKTYMIDENDSTEFKKFIPVTSFIHTFHYSTNFRKFYIEPNGVLTADYFQNSYINPDITCDTVSYHSMKNTLGIALNEGFNKYAKFGMAAYATFENRKFTNMQDSTQLDFIGRNFTTNVLWVGGELTKQQGSILTYQADAKFALSGYNLGDVDINGQLQTRIPLFGDSVIVRANGYFKNTEPSYYYKHYFSNHFKWSNSFDKERRLRIAGEMVIPFTRTHLQAGVENITNYLYFNTEGMPAQNPNNMQALTASLKQNFIFGILHWNNSLVYQKSSNEMILPLPDLSIYSQMYLDFKIDPGTSYTNRIRWILLYKYYSPLYQPDHTNVSLFKTKLKQATIRWSTYSPI
jgi:hypothetical protein